ncbi:MAG: ribosome small subunit-dependent GTPase A [Actinomycetes bacterium]
MLIPGRFAHERIDIGVGDWVGLEGDLVRVVLPRRSAIVRNAAGRTTTVQTLAANVDLAFVVSSLGPDLEPRRIERYLVAVRESGATPEIVLSKADRVDDPGPLVALVESVSADIPIHVVSAVTGLGCDALRARITPGTTAVLLGSSGVGKSTLVNRFVGRDVMATRATRGDDEGRHTTSHRELILLPGGGVLIDSPGIRELQLSEVTTGLADAFNDVEELAADCRFADCAHGKEPGCAVTAAVEAGALPAVRLESWRKLQGELRVIATRTTELARKAEQGRPDDSIRPRGPRPR